MESQSRSLELQQAFQTEPNFDKYARQILENSKTNVAAATAASPSKITDFLQEFGATFINSIQLQNFQKTLHTNHTASAADIAADAGADADSDTADILISNSTKMEIELVPNHIIFGANTFESMAELQKQLEYDKFMNEVWIGIVLTLILISMIFCICSCFLYHQFRTWKRNYYSTVVQVRAADVESVKTEVEMEDPVPQYTLVSGLPSYEAALELMQKTPTKSCLIVYPSVFNVFNKAERSTVQQQQHFSDITTPLLSSATSATKWSETNATTVPTTEVTTQQHNDPTDSTIAGSAINEKGLLELLNAQTGAAVASSATKPLEEVIVFNIEREK